MQTLNVTLLEPKRKHPTIFEWFDALQPGEAFMILNDHDPKPLYYQMIGERGNVFTWSYEEQGPEWWRVIIKKNDAGEGPSVGEIAASDLRKVEVFKKFGLDFSCGGKKSLKQACGEKNIDVHQLEKELENAEVNLAKPAFDFNQWEAGFLADYIYNQHHQYLYRQEKVIDQLFEKVNEHQELSQLHQLWDQFRQEVKTHFIKEEKIIFPMIKQVGEAVKSYLTVPPEISSISVPLQLMETDHDVISGQLAKMQEFFGQGGHPVASQETQLLFSTLQALADDLQLHLHLENNILFPKALALAKQLNSSASNV